MDGVVHEYIYASGKLMRETITDDTTTIVLDFFYDSNGRPYAMKYNGDLLYYVTNLQGDVVALIDNTDGSARATYTYDAWGNIESSSGDMDEKNPLRYRGYYYDTELGMYYLQSRYYDPAVCRFINADNTSLLGVNGDFVSYNLFVYCSNNPVMCADTSGKAWHVIAGGIIGGIAAFASSIAGNIAANEPINLKAAGCSAAIGFVSGCLSSSGLGKVAQVVGGAVLSGLQNISDQVNSDEYTGTIDWAQVGFSAVVGGISSYSNGLDKATKNNFVALEKQAKKRLDRALKQWDAREASSAMKYYFAHTTTRFYAPVLSSAADSVKKSFIQSNITATVDCLF